MSKKKKEQKDKEEKIIYIDEYECELKVLKIYAKLKKAELFDQWKKYCRQILLYLENEWDLEHPPTYDDIISIGDTFAINYGYEKFYKSKAISKKDFEFLHGFILFGINELINGPEEYQDNYEDED